MPHKNALARSVSSSGDSYSITLPKAWARDHDVDEDSELKIAEMEDGRITFEIFE
ncbi:AbrB/MazE/SpoVT family DNA-binding domain-containing protein [Halorhabdus amylolytica]|uniref:AbrB/MazE/SpoVT family DNA-binding domain-containing protein n=1 Tax=Halorhabdus amylolytica TaxID=2559573 RepID=UPI00145AB1BA